MFLGLVWIGLPNASQKDPGIFWKIGSRDYPVDPQSFLPEMRFFFYILVVLRLDLGQISFNLVENAFAIRQLALLSTRIMFCDILAQACTEVKILRQEGDQGL